MSCGDLNLASGKGFGPRDRVMLAVPSVAAAAATPNSQVACTFAGLPRRDEIGRWAHLVGFVIRGTVQYDAVANTMPTAMPGQLMLTAIDQLQLRAGGHFFLQGADGAVLDDDGVMRENKRFVALPADVADMDATNATAILTWIYFFGRPMRADGPARAGDGAIPLFMFDRECDAQAQLQFRIAAVVTSDGGQTASFPGVTFDGFQSSDLEVWAILRFDDNVIDDMVWSVRTLAQPALNGEYSIGDLCEYQYVRDRVGSTNWTPNAADYAGIRSLCGDTIIFDGRTSIEVAQAQNAIVAMGDDGPQAGLGPLVVNVAAPAYLGLVPTPPSRRRLDCARGDLSWSFTGRTDHTTTRVQMRGWSANPNGYRDKVTAMTAKKAKILSRGVMAQNMTPKAKRAAALLPNSIVTD